MVKSPSTYIFCAFFVVFGGCTRQESQGISFATTIHPLKAILVEIVGSRGSVVALVGSGASPHTYEPRPADAAASESALALFYAAGDIDGWAATLPARKRIEVAVLVPEALRLAWDEHEHADEGGHEHEHDHGAFDGHFWSDPLVVKAMLPGLVDTLVSVDPDGAAEYRANGASFASALDGIHADMQSRFAGASKRPVFLFHPSWNYFMRQYGLTVAGIVEPSPGKEPTAQFVKGLIETAKRENVGAIFTEPQLPKRPAEVIAEACGITLLELDPNGGVAGRITYRELIEYNAGMLQEAMK